MTHATDVPSLMRAPVLETGALHPIRTVANMFDVLAIAKALDAAGFTFDDAVHKLVSIFHNDQEDARTRLMAFEKIRRMCADAMTASGLLSVVVTTASSRVTSPDGTVSDRTKIMHRTVELFLQDHTHDRISGRVFEHDRGHYLDDGVLPGPAELRGSAPGEPGGRREHVPQGHAHGRIHEDQA